MATIIETADAPAGTSTTYALALGQTAQGRIATAGDQDWIRVDLVAGQQYSFSVVGSGPTTDNLRDPFLTLRNAAGVSLASDNDAGPGPFSTVTFTATQSGTHYLDISGSGSSFGQYTVSVTQGPRPSYDADMAAAALIRTNASWSAPGTPVTVTWGVRQSGPATDASGNPAPFSQLTATQVAAVAGILAHISEVAGIDFSRVEPAGTTNNATMLIANYSSADDGSGAYAYSPGSTASASVDGDVWLNTESVSTTSLPPGEYSYYTVIHEIGHALGLDHPSDYNAAPGVNLTYAANAQYVQDSTQYSVMSYFEASNTGASFGATQQPQTLMLHDIYALQLLYGADNTTRAGNTTYGFNSTEAGSVYDFTVNSNPGLCIWDGGGALDTLDASGFGQNQVIDLRAGNFSNIGPGVRNVSIAFDVTIERAFGGSGADIVYGNGVANQLYGNAGNDTLYGFDGADMLFGGLGVDFLIGGAGDDTLDGGADADVMFYDLGSDTIIGGLGIDYMSYASGPVQPAGTTTLRIDLLTPGVNAGLALGDTFSGVEAFFLSQGNDLFAGDGANNFVFAQDGNDFISSGGGGDIIYGEGGNDFINTGALSSIVVGGAGADTFYFGLNQVEQEQIFDFEAGTDKIALEDVGFNLVNQGIIAGFNFFATTTALGVSYLAGQSTLIYYTDLSILYADTDGAGGLTANFLAVFGNNAALTAGDFAVL